jgi:hypothetical protein
MTRKKKPPILAISELQATQLPVAVDLPPEIYVGIGKVISAHAILENRVQELLFDLMIMADYPAGRVAFEYRAAPVMFGIARRLIVMWGVTVTCGDLHDLEEDIRSRTADRDRLAHNVWLGHESGVLVLRQSLGMTETERGRIDHSYLPVGVQVASEDFESMRSLILKTAQHVQAVQHEIKPRLEAIRQKRLGTPAP